MEFTIINIRNLEVYDKTTKNWSIYPGYAFLDKNRKTITQCYSENNKKMIEKYLNE